MKKVVMIIILIVAKIVIRVLDVLVSFMTKLAIKKIFFCKNLMKKVVVIIIFIVIRDVLVSFMTKLATSYTSSTTTTTTTTTTTSSSETWMSW